MGRQAPPPIRIIRPRKATLRDDSSPARATGRTPRQRRLLAGALTVGAHLALIGTLLWLHAAPPPAERKQTEAPLEVSLLPKPEPPGPPDMADAGAPSIAPPPLPAVAAPSLTIIRTVAVKTDNSDLLSDSQIAGAAHAGEGGGGGGGCDMARAVQQALRRDALVRGAVEGAGRTGKASMVWNGDWVRSGGQDGKGLAAVRQAILWEVGFAPAACRNQPVHGMVVLSLADGRTRFAVGGGEWRWADLLGLRSVSR